VPQVMKGLRQVPYVDSLPPAIGMAAVAEQTDAQRAVRSW
jgi:hypothetical protein